MELVEEIRGAFAAETLLKRVLPIAGSIIGWGYVGAKIEEWVRPHVPAEWVSTVSYGLYGVGLLALTAYVLPADWKDAGRLAAYSGFALAVHDALKALRVIQGGSPQRSPSPRSPPPRRQPPALPTGFR